MAEYKPIFQAPDDTDEDGDAIPLTEAAVARGTTSNHDQRASTSTVPESPTSRRHGSNPKDSGDDHQYDSDEEEVLELMARGRTSRDKAEESDLEAPLFKDEDLDIDSAMTMVRRVSSETDDCYRTRCRPTSARRSNHISRRGGASPFIQLRPLVHSQIVPESDDPTMPALTFRVFLLGSILCVFGGECRELGRTIATRRGASLNAVVAPCSLRSCRVTTFLLQVERSFFVSSRRSCLFRKRSRRCSADPCLASAPPSSSSYLLTH